MVVGDPHDMNPPRGDARVDIDPVFRSVVCDPLKRANRSDTNRLYANAIATRPVFDMFGFVPCLPAG